MEAIDKLGPDNLGLDNLTVDSLQLAMKRLESRFVARAASRMNAANDIEASSVQANQTQSGVSFYLFNNRNSEQRLYLKDIALTLPNTAKIRYRGQELRSDDYAVWSELLLRARQQTSADYIEFTPRNILKKLSWCQARYDRARLRDCLERMQATALCITRSNAEQGMSMSLIAKYGWIQATTRSPGRWQVWIEPEILALFDAPNTESEQIAQSDLLVQWLRRVYSTHNNPYPRRVETLWQQCPYNYASESFADALQKALQSLAQQGFLSHYQIDDNDLVHIKKNITKRH